MTANEFCVRKKTLNSGYIYFDDPKKARQWRDVLIAEKVQYITFVSHIGEWTYYGFKMYRMKYQFLKLCRKFEEIMGV